MDKQKYELKEKGTAEVYRIRNIENGAYWADIVLSELGRSGQIFITSDFGDWQYRWATDNFKKFLTTMDKGYAAEKFKANKFFDANATLDMYTDIIQDTGRDYLLQPIAELRGSFHLEDFKMQLREKKDLMDYFDGVPEIVYAIDPGFNRFWDGPWQTFLETIKEEV